MSKGRRVAEAIVQTPEAGEEFIAILLWAQKGSCKCPACVYFREMAGRLVKTHVKGGESSG